METQLRHSLADGATHLRGRFKVASTDDVVSRAYLNVNTTRSAAHVDAYVRKFVSLAGSRQRLADERVRAGAGVRCLFGSNQQEQVYAGAIVKKEFHWKHAGQRSSQVKVRCACDWNAIKFKVASPVASGRVLASIQQMKFTKRHDIQLTAGAVWSYAVNSSKTSSLRVSPMLRARENNWAVTVTVDNPKKWLEDLQRGGGGASSSRTTRPKPQILFSYNL
eukprot:jgi/Ulvmu1/11475/UM077_0019.1